MTSRSTPPACGGGAAGRGVGVAVIDTGITGDLPDFRTSRWNSDARAWSPPRSSTPTPPPPLTPTATAPRSQASSPATATSRDCGDPLRNEYAGSAPNANLISVKVANDDGQATTLDALYGLQFAVDHKDDYNIRVINMSFRSTDAESYKTDPLDAAAEQAWFDGITVVAAAGNMGTASDAVSYAPGNDPYVITVGAVDDQGTARQRRRHRSPPGPARAPPRTASPSPTWWRPARTSSPRWRPTRTSPASAPPA